ncbi:MAG: transposase [Nitrosomonadales bacterium]|nr:transposase [Nitrosomonadales bacterium]
MSNIVTTESSGVAQIAVRFGVDSDDLGVLARIGSDSINRAMFEITRAGLAFLRAQELLSLGDFGNSVVCERSHTDDDGGFIEWIEKNGMAKERVYESMRIAKFVMRLPAGQVDEVLALGKVKVMLLASLPQEVIDEAAQTGEGLIGKAELMTVRQLKDEVAALKRREKNYEAELEVAQRKVERLSEAKQRLTQFELRTEELRAECMALQLEAELPLNALHKLFEEELNDVSGSPEARLRLEQVWIVAHNAVATGLDMLEKLHELDRQEQLGLPSRQMSQHILLPSEAADWLLNKPLIENRYEGQRALREDKRVQDTPRRGRPKGSKNKADGE